MDGSSILPDEEVQQEQQQQQRKLQQEIDKLQDAMKVLRKNDEAVALSAFCQLMQDKQLPASAQLFILKFGLHSVEQVDTKDQELLDAVKSTTRLEFPVKCVEQFVQYCKEGSHNYYSIGQQKYTVAPPVTESVDKGNSVSSRQRAVAVSRCSGSLADNHQDQARAVSTDNGYGSTAEEPMQQQQQQQKTGTLPVAMMPPLPVPPTQPTPRRRGSTVSESAVAAAVCSASLSMEEAAAAKAAAANRGYRGSEPTTTTMAAAKAMAPGQQDQQRNHHQHRHRKEHGKATAGLMPLFVLPGFKKSKKIHGDKTA